jgi:hypothetical protein
MAPEVPSSQLIAQSKTTGKLEGYKAWRLEGQEAVMQGFHGERIIDLQDLCYGL